MLETFDAAVAIYGPDSASILQRGLLTLRGIEDDWLAGEPMLDELLERLRETPHIRFADFRIFKRQQIAMFTSLIEPLHRTDAPADARTLSVSVSPHPLGGLIFVYEDVTDRLALESSYNTLIEVQRETLDNLFEGICGIRQRRAAELHNPVFRRSGNFATIFPASRISAKSSSGRAAFLRCRRR